jgi:2'-5' RNA ligase
MKDLSTGETGLVVVPPPEIRNEINMWRRIFNAYDDMMTPHITVLYPFVPAEVWDQARDRVIEALKGIKPFRVKLRELGSFVRDESVLWLKPEDGSKLMKINVKMRRLFSEYLIPSSLAYVPHLTLGYFAKIEDLFKARTTVQKQLKPLQFTVERVIYAVFEEEGWRIHDHVSL